MRYRGILDKLVVISPPAEVDHLQACELLDQLTTVLSSRHQFIVLLDMSQVESLDDSGLKILLSTAHLAQRLERSFYLCSVSTKLRLLLQQHQLEQKLPIYPDRATLEMQLLCPAEMCFDIIEL